MKKWVVALMVCSLGSAVAMADPANSAPAPSAGITIEKMAVGTAIENKELSGTASEFDSSIGRVTCWARVNTESAPVMIKQIWYADGNKEAEVPLEIKYPSSRTWSSKNVWPGQWKVEAIGPSGDVLNTVEFSVKAAAQ